MNCNKCGIENADTNIYCTNCGNLLNEQPTAEAVKEEAPVSETPMAPQPPVAPKPKISINPVAEKVIWIFKDKLFLALCILVSAECGISLLGGDLSVFRILFTIFLWLIYSKAQKNLVDVANMRNISGTIFANYIVGWVLFGILSFLTIIIVAIGSASGIYLDEILADVDMGGLQNILGSLSVSIILIVFVIIMLIAIAITLLATLAYSSIHKFAKSLYTSVQTGTFNLVKVDSSRNWFLFLGIAEIVSAVSSLTNIFSFLSTGCSVAVYFIAYTLIKKYFQPVNVQ